MQRMGKVHSANYNGEEERGGGNTCNGITFCPSAYPISRKM